MLVNWAEFLLWTAIIIIIYTFLGFPILIGIFARLFPRLVVQSDIIPSLTLLIPAYNEANIIEAKIKNCLALDYPTDKLTIAFVTDGSTDETPDIVERYRNHGVQCFHQPERRGKIAAVNRVLPLLTGDIIVFSDANTFHSSKTLKAITKNFKDESVGAVAGEKRVLGGGEGLYWRYESFLKRSDSAFSSVMGAAGELFAVRRELVEVQNETAIIEDFILSMRLVQAGWRVVYEPDAIAEEPALSSLSAEWQRRIRIAAGGFQSIWWLRTLLNPKYGRIAWQYISHRVLRWTVTPFLLPSIFFVNLFLLRSSFYRWLFIGQILFYGVALWGWWQAIRGKQRGLPYIIFFFCFTNLAAIVGFWRYITRTQSAIWAKTR